MKNIKRYSVFIVLFLTVTIKINAQDFFDNSNKTWGHSYKNTISNGAEHISRAKPDEDKLFLSINKGENIPNKVWRFNNLMVLDITGPYNGCCPLIEEIPSELSSLKHLEYIYFSGISIQSFPSDLSALTKLKSFYLSFPKVGAVEFKQLPDFATTPSLEVLYIDINSTNDISNAGNFSSIFENPELKILVLKNVKIQSDVFQNQKELSHLEIIDLGGNELLETPTINSNNQLKQLLLRGNKLTSVNSNIGTLENLEVLDLGYNDLLQLPEEIGNLKNLKMLDLNDNNIKELPDSFEELQQLEYLVLRGNDLTEIPEFVYKLKNLKDLDLMSTKISTIDERILNTNIEALRISHQEINGFDFDPKMLAQLKSLKTFQTSNLRADKRLSKSKKKLKRLRSDL